MKVGGYARPTKRPRGSIPLWAMIVLVIAVLHVGVGIAWAALRFQVRQQAASHQREYVKYFDIAPLAPTPEAAPASVDTASAPAPGARTAVAPPAP
jgi:hypothetical protein